MAMLARYSASGETMIPPLMTRSTFSVDVIAAISSQHCPATIDRKVHARDLARHVACKEQTGVGDVVVDGNALQRIVGGVPFGGLLFGNAELGGHVAADFFAKARPVDHSGRDAVDVDVVLTDLQRETLGDAAKSP